MASQEIIDGHIANFKELKRNGGKAQDVLAYLADPIYKVDKTTAQQIFRDPQFREAFIDTEANTARQALGQGTLMGGGDELEGFIRGLLPGNTVSKEIDMVRAENELYQRARPYKSLALQVAGGIPTGLYGTGRALARRGVGLLPRILEGGISGAKTGATSGFLRSEGGLDEEGKIDVLGGLQSRGIGAARGAGTGAVTGVSLPIIGDAVRAVGRGVGRVVGATPGLDSQTTRQAGRMMRTALDDDELTVPAIRRALSKMPAQARIPDTADQYSIAMRDLARFAATTQGGKAANKFLMERQAEQAPRLLEQVDKFLPTMSLDEYLEITSEQKRLDANQPATFISEILP